ncbi:MAG: M67 family metallopeptidase [Deltaproteobacteria bacterium]|nr:M67 family metallopeptidase [Deltaproteobacteria bacterium]
MTLPESVLRAIREECLRCHPAEACGLLIADAQGAPQFVAIQNIAGTQEGRRTSSRSGRDGYVMDPKAMMRALNDAEDSGGRLAAIVHSHPEVGAYFSKEDRDMALGGGDEPLWPGVEYLVVSVRTLEGKSSVDDARLYRWNQAKRDFDESQIKEITTLS